MIHWFFSPIYTDLLDTPPGFECGMKFERKSYEQADYIHSQPQKIYLSEVLAMNDTLDFEMLTLDDTEDKQEEINLQDVRFDNFLVILIYKISMIVCYIY